CFFRELRHGYEDGPELKKSLLPKAQQYEIEIVKYLNSGILFIACMGLTGDILDPSNDWAIAPHILTDGVWAWPADFGYYVENYHAKVESDFVEHMVAVNWTMAEEENIDFDSLEDD
ncbi:MAG: hypothetical protein F6K30_29015, partial [Cyanothece sp. SIO2G6]|nr:hypothetical protein [Cyanothece sp. SIO2G6]